MIRPFDLLDIPLLAQLENRGTALSSDVLTRGARPLQAALAGFFSLHSRGEYTFVMSQRPGGFAQMRLRKTVPRAAVTYVSPGLSAGNGTSDMWAQLIEALANASGELGLQQLVAEVLEEGNEVPLLHRCGFAIFLRQDILRLKEWAALTPELVTLRPCSEFDIWGVQQLYLNIAPKLAQQAEVPPHVHHSSAARGYVMEEGGEVMAYLDIRSGAAGSILGAIIHPQAEPYAQGIIAQGIALLGDRRSLPIHWCVRRYQEWLWGPLQSLGFEPFISTAVMVKRLVVPLAEPERVPGTAHVLVRKVTTPIVHSRNARVAALTHKQEKA